jgi:hypothetical protein
VVADGDAEHLPHVGRRVGADQQHALALRASCMAVAQAMEVLPTPPLPVKNRKRGGCCRKFMGAFRDTCGVAATAFAAGAATACGSHFGQDRGCCRRGQASPARQLGAVRVAAGQRDFAVHQHQRQRLGTRALQKGLHGGVLGKVHRLLGQVEALDGAPLLLRPVEVGRG